MRFYVCSFYACFLLSSLTWSLELSRKRKFIQDRQDFLLRCRSSKKNSKYVRLVPISVSQNTALERLGKDFGGGILVDYEESFSNNAVNACAFIFVTLAHLLLPDRELTNILQHAMQDKIIKTAELVIDDFPGTSTW